ncbi:MAG: arsenate reductase ArsC [Methylotetracoccus sp.]|jgi:arsenate reductase|nr:arsenate reductase ArsC [Methylotetracoccus sp.]
MAEALLNYVGQGRFHAYSAGSHPTGTIEQLALEKLLQAGIPAPQARSKAWEEFAQLHAPVMDFVITACEDAMRDVCPIWPGRPIVARWAVFDPVAVAARDGQFRIAFAKAFVILERRIVLFASLNPASLKRLALSHYVRAIGNDEP